MRIFKCSMKLIVAFKVSVAVGLGLFGTESARADTVLLSLTDMGYTETLYNLDFIANASTTSLSVEGYEPNFFWVAAINSVTPLGGGANMLGDTWTFVPASSGSAGLILPDVISVPALGFGGATIGSYDTFSQTFATTPGTEYVYQFMLYNDLGPADVANPSGILVTTTASAVPEPSTWAMLILGFLGVGFMAYRAHGIKRSLIYAI
jgi:PEP-CTERM motif